MLDIREVDGEIARLEAGSPTMNDCAKLAILWSVRDRYWPEDSRQETRAPKNSSPELVPVTATVQARLDNYGDSEFLLVVAGKVPADAWAIMDDLMETLLAVNPRVYESVMRRLRQL